MPSSFSSRLPMDLRISIADQLYIGISSSIIFCLTVKKESKFVILAFLKSLKKDK
jgi:hypothetical protein